MKDTCAVVLVDGMPVKVFRKEFQVYEWLKDRRRKHPTTDYKVIHSVNFVK
jgi:hypothetical protein